MSRSDRPISAAKVKLLVFDVDGVLTDGGIYVDDHGREFKRFDVTDGLAIGVWQKLGLTIAIITGRTGGTVLNRAAYLGIAHLRLASRDKAADLAAVCKETGIRSEETAFLADDWPDLAVLRRVGYPMAVANAAREVKALARFVTKREGGRGAAREAIEHLLSSKGLFEKALALYDSPNART